MHKMVGNKYLICCFGSDLVLQVLHLFAEVFWGRSLMVTQDSDRSVGAIVGQKFAGYIIISCQAQTSRHQVMNSDCFSFHNNIQ